MPIVEWLLCCGANLGRLFLDCGDCARRIICALFLIPLFSSHLASLCRKKAGGTFLCKFFNSAKTDFKKGGLVLHFLLCCRLGVPARYSVARAILKSSNRRGLAKTDSAQSVNNESQKSIRYFLIYKKGHRLEVSFKGGAYYTYDGGRNFLCTYIRMFLFFMQENF